MNTFTIDKCYPRCYKVNDVKTFKNFLVSFYALWLQLIWLARLTGAFKNHVHLVLCIIESDQKDIKLYVLGPFHLQRANRLWKLKQSIYSQDVDKKDVNK